MNEEMLCEVSSDIPAQVIKELAYAIESMDRTGILNNEMRSKCCELLYNEINLQLLMQEDFIREYTANRNKKQLKGTNVSPIKR